MPHIANPQDTPNEVHIPVLHTQYTCRDCRGSYERDEVIELDRYGFTCLVCIESHYSQCLRCDRTTHDRHFHRDEEVCDECFSENENQGDNDAQIHFRSYMPSSQYLNSGVGGIVKNSIPFGIELEVTLPDNLRASILSRSIPREVGVETDGSIVGGYGLELQLPPACGASAENLIYDVCSKLKEMEARVNRSCGYHLHIDVAKVDTDHTAASALNILKDLWLFYVAFEDVIVSFLPKSRRNNRYCQSLRSDYHFREIMQATSMEKLERIWYRVTNRDDLDNSKGETKHSSRYRGINMHTLFAMRHIEIRYHSGTINARKILEWANLHTTIINCALEHKLIGPALFEANSNIDLAEKTNLFFNMLGIEKKSEDYFRIRQEIFAPKVNYSMSKKNKKEAEKVLSEENEQ